MLPFSRFANRFWLLGLGLSVLGIALVRLIAPAYPKPVIAYITGAGHLLALLGLFVIAYGISRRLRGAQEKDSPP